MLKQKNPRYFISACVMVLLAFVAWRFIIQKPAPVKLQGSQVPTPVALTNITFKSSDSLTQLSDYKGKWLLLFFGFTHCPDVCPTSLAYIKDEYHALLELRPYVRVGFVSVDPERDDSATCSTFVKNFEKDFGCILADEENLKTLSKELGSFANKDGEGKDYNIVHAGDIYLVSPQGEWIAFYRPPFAKGVLQQDLQALIQRHM